jgi:hypothetical protein
MPNVTSNDVEEALRKVLGSYGLDHVEIESRLDHDGERAVFVTAVVPRSTPPIPGDVSASANVAIAKVMERAGDERLSYLYIRRPDDLRPEDESRAPLR